MTTVSSLRRAPQVGTASARRLRAGAERVRAWGMGMGWGMGWATGFGKRLVWLLTLAATAVAAQPLPPTLLAIDFDQLAQGVLPPGVAIETQFKTPDVVPGVAGSAWRTDGFSSYAEAVLALDPKAGFSLSLWLALESFPADREVPVRELSPSSFIQQAAGDAGFDLHIDAYGRWGFRVATTGRGDPRRRASALAVASMGASGGQRQHHVWGRGAVPGRQPGRLGCWQTGNGPALGASAAAAGQPGGRGQDIGLRRQPAQWRL